MEKIEQHNYLKCDSLHRECIDRPEHCGYTWCGAPKNHPDHIGYQSPDAPNLYAQLQAVTVERDEARLACANALREKNEQYVQLAGERNRLLVERDKLQHEVAVLKHAMRNKLSNWAFMSNKPWSLIIDEALAQAKSELAQKGVRE